MPESLGGLAIDLTDPGGNRVRVVSGTHDLAALPAQAPLTFNFGHDTARANATQRPPREPAKVQRLGHVVLQTTRYLETLNWYLEHLGLIVSDFLDYAGQRDPGPAPIRPGGAAAPAPHPGGPAVPNLIIDEGRRFDEVAAGRFAVVSSASVTVAQRAEVERRGGVLFLARPGGELHRWLRRAHATAAIVRPDGTVLRAGRDLSSLCASLPRFAAAAVNRDC